MSRDAGTLWPVLFHRSWPPAAQGLYCPPPPSAGGPSADRRGWRWPTSGTASESATPRTPRCGATPPLTAGSGRRPTSRRRFPPSLSVALQIPHTVSSCETFTSLPYFVFLSRLNELPSLALRAPPTGSTSASMGLSRPLLGMSWLAG